MTYDFIIIGGGIVGVSTAWQLQQRFANKNILLLEKEGGLARHQTGHNSGVIHAGIYYAPGSLKAEFCKQGVQATIAFCKQNRIPFEQCGKLLVATNQGELERMQALFQRCRRNGITVRRLDRDQLRQYEPNIVGNGALLVASTGIVNYPRICREMCEQFRALGGGHELNSEVVDIRESDREVTVTSKSGVYAGAYLIVCGGLMADRLARMHGIDIDFQIIPFRGEYYRLPADKNSIISHNIYPIPDPDLPFLGVHLTRMLDGGVMVGPNAVLGLKREGYGKINFKPYDVIEMLRFKGFWKLLHKYPGYALSEMKNSIWKRAYLKQIRKYCPGLSLEDLLPHPAGIRAQAVRSDGTLVHDFLFAGTSRSLHVCNAPSPAATSAIPIGSYICDMITNKTG